MEFLWSLNPEGGTVSALARIALVPIALLIAACTAKEAVQGDDSAVNVASASGENDPSWARAPQGLIGPPGVNADSTADYMMRHVDFGKDVKTDSGFVDDFTCTGCTQPTVRLMVMPEKKANHVDWPTAFVNRDLEGWVVAEVVNVDPRNVVYKELELAFNDTAYQWVGPISVDGKSRGVAWYRIDRAKGLVTGGPYSLITKVTYCDDPGWKKRKHGVAMRKHGANESCEAKVYSPPGGAAVEPQKTPLFPPGGTWISCAGGCCEVSDLN
jgi:hypothetical protein